MNCEEINKYIGDYIDGELPTELIKEFENHLSTCNKCREEVEIEKRLVASLKKLRLEENPETLYPTVLGKIRESKEKKGFIDKIFSPFIIRIPVASVGLIFIIVATILIYTNLLKRGVTTPTIYKKEIPQTILPRAESEFKEEPSIKTAAEEETAQLSSTKDRMIMEKKKIETKQTAPEEQKILLGQKGEIKSYGHYVASPTPTEKISELSEKKYKNISEDKKVSTELDKQIPATRIGGSVTVTKEAPAIPQPSPSPASTSYLGDKVETQSRYYYEEKIPTPFPASVPMEQIPKAGQYKQMQPSQKVGEPKKELSISAGVTIAPETSAQYPSEGVIHTKPTQAATITPSAIIATEKKLGTPQGLAYEVHPIPTYSEVSEKYVLISDNYDKAITEIKKVLKNYHYDYEKLTRKTDSKSGIEKIYLTTTQDEWKSIEAELDKINRNKEDIKEKIAVAEKEKVTEAKLEATSREGRAVLFEESLRLPQNKITVVIEIKITK